MHQKGNVQHPVDLYKFVQKHTNLLSHIDTFYQAEIQGKAIIRERDVKMICKMTLRSMMCNTINKQSCI